MYFPGLISEASSGYPLVLQLRAGNSHPGKGVAGLLRWLFWRLRKAFPGVRVMFRADAGFALPEILRVCERSGVGYAIGYARNAVTEHKIAPLLERARLQFHQTQAKARLFDDVYYSATTWDEPRRLVMKAEWLPKGANPRFVLPISTCHRRSYMTDSTCNGGRTVNIASRNSSLAFMQTASVATTLLPTSFACCCPKRLTSYCLQFAKRHKELNLPTLRSSAYGQCLSKG